MTRHERVELRRQLAADTNALVAAAWEMIEAAFLAGQVETRKQAALEAYIEARSSAPSPHHWTDEIKETRKVLDAVENEETAAHDADTEALEACRSAMMALWMKARTAGSSA